MCKGDGILAKEFNYRDSLNMVTAVSTSYVPRIEIVKYFADNFEKEKMFTQDELKAIVKELVSEREKSGRRISKSMNEIWKEQGKTANGTKTTLEDEERE